MSKLPGSKLLLTYFAVGAGLAALALAAYTQVQSPAGTARAAAQATSPVMQEAAADWEVGELRPNGLRIKPSGRSDAFRVLDPEQFTRPEVQNAYAIAHKIPATVNKLYCWCGCENRGIHRSNLGCFEDKMAVHCGVCRGTAEIAYEMTQDGVTDAGKIQAAVDMEWGPEWAKKEQRKRQG